MYVYNRYYMGIKIREEVKGGRSTFKADVDGTYFMTSDLEIMCRKIEERLGRKERRQ